MPFALTLRRLRSTCLITARLDARLLRQHPRFALAVVAALWVPALYALIYLSSMWDPASHAGNLKVALVNGDLGTAVQGQRVNLGDTLVRRLEQQAVFSFERVASPQQARQAVRQGRFSFAVIVPPAFSQRAVPGDAMGSGKLEIYTSEGNNYTGAGFAKRFAPELAHQVNQALNEQRWGVVLATALGSGRSVAALRAATSHLEQGANSLAKGSAQAQDAAGALAHGAEQLHRASGQLSSGLGDLSRATVPMAGNLKQVAGGLHELQARWPAEAELKALQKGASQLVDGQRALGHGLLSLEQGAAALRDGSAELGDQVGSLPLVGDRLAQATQGLESGAQRLHQGLGTAASSSDQLTLGAGQLAGGVTRLGEGLGTLGQGITRLGRALPDDSATDTLTTGLQAAAQGSQAMDSGLQRWQAGERELGNGLAQLRSGSEALAIGLQSLGSLLPARVDQPGGTAPGLSESVQPELVIAAPVANQGSGFVPDFVPLALWIGATLTTFLFSLRQLPSHLIRASRWGLTLGKLGLPALVVTGQIVVMLVMLVMLLDLHVASLWRFFVTLLITGGTFLALIFALVRLLGDAGKILALLFLILQIAAAGATMPIELTSPFFQWIHPWLPLTWVVQALRVTMFGAFDGAWWQAVVPVLGTGLLSLLVATQCGRWKPVALCDYGPVVDLG
jgi:putative membrane protein